MRIISLTPSTTKELIHLGMAEQIVGATSLCELSEDNES